MSVYPSEYLDDEYDGSTYSHHLHPDFDHGDLAVGGDGSYLAGPEKFPGFWDDAMSAGSWSDAGMPDALLNGAMAPVPEMIGGDFYPDRFLPPNAFTDAAAAAAAQHHRHRPHRSATAPSRPTSSPNKSPKLSDVKTHSRHGSRYAAQRGYAVKPVVEKLKTSSSKSHTSRSSTSNSNTAASTTDANGSKYTRTHYVVEKRYRTNLNDKFEELRDCLTTARQYLSEDYCPDGQTGSSGPGSAAGGDDTMRMSKTRVLGEAVEYIRHLEEQNDRAMDTIELLERRISTGDGDESMSDS